MSFSSESVDPTDDAPPLAAHWDAAYAAGDATKSWTQARPARSLAAIAAATADRGTAIVDVGGGSSTLAAELLRDGYRDVTVLDVSDAALSLARGRLGAEAARVTWVAGDLLAWRPEQRYGVWHDRAVLHFFTTDADRARYAEVVRAAVVPGGCAIIATFAPDGPTSCSGLPVRRSSPEQTLALLGPGFTLVRADRERHRTPSGSEQAFAWLIARRAAG